MYTWCIYIAIGVSGLSRSVTSDSRRMVGSLPPTQAWIHIIIIIISLSLSLSLCVYVYVYICNSDSPDKPFIFSTSEPSFFTDLRVNWHPSLSYEWIAYDNPYNILSLCLSLCNVLHTHTHTHTHSQRGPSNALWFRWRGEEWNPEPYREHRAVPRWRSCTCRLRSHHRPPRCG